MYGQCTETSRCHLCSSRGLNCRTRLAHFIDILEPLNHQEQNLSPTSHCPRVRLCGQHECCAVTRVDTCVVIVVEKFLRCMRPALVLPIVDPSPTCPMRALLRALLRLSGLPPARCGGRLLRLVSFGQLVGGGSRKVLWQTAHVWEGASCDAGFWCSVPSRFHCGPPATAGSRSYVHSGCYLPVGHRSTFFVTSLSSFISLSLRRFFCTS